MQLPDETAGVCSHAGATPTPVHATYRRAEAIGLRPLPVSSGGHAATPDPSGREERKKTETENPEGQPSVGTGQVPSNVGTGRQQHQDLHPTGAVIARASTDFTVFRLRVGQTATNRELQKRLDRTC